MNNSIKNDTIKIIADQAIEAMYEGARVVGNIIQALDSKMDEDQRRSINLAVMASTSAIDSNISILQALIAEGHYEARFSLDALRHVERLSRKAWMAVSAWRDGGDKPSFRIDSDLYRCFADLHDIHEEERAGVHWSTSGKFEHWDYLAASIEEVA